MSTRAVVILFFIVFFVFTISSYIADKRSEASLIKNLETVHNTKIVLANELIAKDTPISVDTKTENAVKNILSTNSSCESQATSTDSCVDFNNLVDSVYFSKNDYEDIAIFNTVGARVFYKSKSTQKLTPTNLSPRPQQNKNFTQNSTSAHTYIGKAGTTPNGTMLVAYEILNGQSYLGTITFIVKQTSFDLYGKNTGGNFTTYAIDSSGSTRNLSLPSKSVQADEQILIACKAKESKTITSNQNGLKTFSAISYVPQLDMCIVTETNSLSISDISTNTYLTNYIIGLILLFFIWLISKLLGNKIGKKLNNLKGKGEATLLGKEPEFNKESGIQEIDDLSKTFDFILHKLKSGKNAEESAELLQKNILTKVKSTTTEALASRDKFKEAVDAAQDIIILLTPSGLVTYANKALEKTTGFRFDHVEGKYPYETWHKDGFKDEFQTALANTLSNKTSTIINAEGKRGDGGTYESELRLSPVENIHTGAVDSVLMVERDISDERQRDRVKTEFISVVSHELRTPMTVIRGYSALLAEGKLGELNQKQKDYIGRINAETSRLLDLANDMLDLQKFDAGKADLHLENLDLRDLLKDVVEEFEPFFSKKDIALTFEDHSENPHAMVDKRYLRRAITNLVQNAMKFTEKGGVSVFVVNPDKDYVVIAIKDTGSGIPQEALPHLFTKFYQASNVLNRKQEGSGLGLSIVKKIVEAHKGIVWVESLENVGTTFYIALPLAK